MLGGVHLPPDRDPTQHSTQQEQHDKARLTERNPIHGEDGHRGSRPRPILRNFRSTQNRTSTKEQTKMTPDTMNLIAELEQRVSELSAALELVTEDRDNLRDAGNSLMHELEACRATLIQAHSDISRLRVYLAQGAEL